MARLKEYNGHYCESEYEYAFIGFLEAEGWKYSSGNNIRRVTKRDVLIADDFKKFIADTNPDLTEDEVTQIYDNVRLVGAESDFATLHKVYGWMVNGVQFTQQDGLPRMIPLIDFDNWDKNIFRVVNQFTVEYTNNGQKENRRPDVLLFVNGMPLCVVELKNPADANATIYDAWEQINIRYWRDIPHLLHYCPLACISDGVKTRLGTVRTPYEHFYAWRRVTERDAVSTLPFAETETMIKGVYAPERFLEIFRDYIYFQDSIYDSDEVEIVCRYPQFFAARLLKQSIIKSVVEKSGKGGTYFGATGCGKTYTMAFLARQLALRCIDIPEIGSPTIILIVDRDELQKQGSKLFTKSKEFLNLGEVSVVKNRTQLRQELGARQSGGFYICTIQKFCDREDDKIGLINDRQNIICFSDEAHRTQLEHSKKIQFSKDADEKILGEPSRLERLATDIHDHYVASCAGDPDRIQKAMVVCSNRKIAYALLQKFKDKYPEWFEEKKSPDGVSVTEEELKELKPMPFMAMVSSVGSNDEKDMYDYLGGVKNDKRSEELDAAFKQEKSNFSIVIVVDMWITGFDVPCLTYLYNDKPLKKHLLIQTISRVNRKYPGKEYGMVIDYIGIRDNMREAMKVYGGDTSVAPTADDVEQATSVFREELEVLKNMFTGYDLSPFLNPECDPIERYRLLAKAAEYVFVSTEELQSEGNNGVQKVSFKTYFLKTVKRMRAAFDICQPSGYLGEEESALAQCFMAIAGFVRKMSGTSEVDTDTMNRAVSKMVEEALKYNQVESVLESGEEEDIFSPEYFEKLSDVKMPATKLELLVKMLRKQIKEYGKVNQLAAKSFQEMLEKTIAEYHERRKHLTAEEAGETQEKASEDIIKIATEQALAILRQMNENRESFRKIGLTFEEKAFYDILISLRDQYNFEYGTDKEVDGVAVNDKCKALAKKIKDIIDTKSSFADWLNNQNVRNQLKLDIKICLVKNGYPPQYSPEVFNKVMEQVENFEEYSITEDIGNEVDNSAKIYQYEPEYKVMKVAEDSIHYGDSKNNQ